MGFVRVYSEWDLGIPEFYEDEDLARMHVRQALEHLGFEESVEELENECLISYEFDSVTMRPE